jgi:hypothetical protein
MVNLFFNGTIGNLVRIFPHKCLPLSSNCYIAMDASIWGGGAILVIDNVIQHWFITEWSAADHVRHCLRKGDSGNMSFWEALTLLCAVRLWLPAAPLAGQVRIKSDSLAALRLAVKLASPSAVLNRIGCELALDLARDLYKLELCHHIAGITNVVPDVLSRQFGPDAKPMPIACTAALQVQLPPRDAAFWTVNACVGTPKKKSMVMCSFEGAAWGRFVLGNLEGQGGRIRLAEHAATRGSCNGIVAMNTYYKNYFA